MRDDRKDKKGATIRRAAAKANGRGADEDSQANKRGPSDPAAGESNKAKATFARPKPGRGAAQKAASNSRSGRAQSAAAKVAPWADTEPAAAATKAAVPNRLTGSNGQGPAPLTATSDVVEHASSDLPGDSAPLDDDMAAALAALLLPIEPAATSTEPAPTSQATDETGSPADQRTGRAEHQAEPQVGSKKPDAPNSSGLFGPRAETEAAPPSNRNGLFPKSAEDSTQPALPKKLVAKDAKSGGSLFPGVPKQPEDGSSAPKSQPATPLFPPTTANADAESATERDGGTGLLPAAGGPNAVTFLPIEEHDGQDEGRNRRRFLLIAAVVAVVALAVGVFNLSRADGTVATNEPDEDVRSVLEVTTSTTVAESDETPETSTSAVERSVTTADTAVTSTTQDAELTATTAPASPATAAPRQTTTPRATTATTATTEPGPTTTEVVEIPEVTFAPPTWAVTGVGPSTTETAPPSSTAVSSAEVTANASTGSTGEGDTPATDG